MLLRIKNSIGEIFLCLILRGRTLCRIWVLDLVRKAPETSNLSHDSVFNIGGNINSECEKQS